MERTVYMKESVFGLPETSKRNHNCLLLNKRFNDFVNVEFTDKYLKIVNSICYISSGHFSLIYNTLIH